MPTKKISSINLWKIIHKKHSHFNQTVWNTLCKHQGMWKLLKSNNRHVCNTDNTIQWNCRKQNEALLTFSNTQNPPLNNQRNIYWPNSTDRTTMHLLSLSTPSLSQLERSGIDVTGRLLFLIFRSCRTSMCTTL